MPPSCDSNDLLYRKSAIFLWCLPIIGIVVGISWHAARPWLWIVALCVMGVGCLANARRCGRVHCYFAGPFFLLMALVTLLYALGVVSLGRHGWSALSLAILVGGFATCCVPELFFGRYRRRAR